MPQIAQMVRRVRRELNVPVVCLLQGEEAYVDSLPPAHRDPAWQLLAERAADVRVRRVARGGPSGQRVRRPSSATVSTSRASSSSATSSTAGHSTT